MMEKAIVGDGQERFLEEVASSRFSKQEVLQLYPKVILAYYASKMPLGSYSLKLNL